jgi:hypothetical protein
MSVLSVAIAGLMPEFTLTGKSQDATSGKWKKLAEMSYAAGLRAEHTENGSKTYDADAYADIRLAFIAGLDKKTAEMMLRAGTTGMSKEEIDLRRKGMMRLGPMWLNCRKYLRACEPAKERGAKTDPVKKAKPAAAKPEKPGFDLRTPAGVKGSLNGMLSHLALWCEPAHRDAVENAVRAVLAALPKPAKKPAEKK